MNVDKKKEDTVNMSVPWTTSFVACWSVGLGNPFRSNCYLVIAYEYSVLPDVIEVLYEN